MSDAKPGSRVCPTCGMNHYKNVLQKGSTQERIRELRRELAIVKAERDRLHSMFKALWDYVDNGVPINRKSVLWEKLRKEAEDAG